VINALISNIAFADKPVNEKIGKIKKSFFTPHLVTTECTLDTLTEKISKGCSVTPAYVTKSKEDKVAPSNKSSFISQQIWFIDIDNYLNQEKGGIDEKLSLTGLHESLQKHNLRPFIIHETFSSKPNCLRFRVGFCTAIPVTEKEAREQIIKGIVGLFISEGYKYVDTKCTDISRLFYGTTQSKVCFSNSAAFIDLEQFKSTVLPFSHLYQTKKTNKKRERKSTKETQKQRYLKSRITYKNNQLHQQPDKILIKNFDVFNACIQLSLYHRVVDVTLDTQETAVQEYWFSEVADEVYQDAMSSVLDERYREANKVPFEVFSSHTLGQMFCCEFHDDYDPSAHIMRTDFGEYRYKCFGCDISISPVEYVSRSLGIRKIEAIDYILRKSRKPTIDKLLELQRDLADMQKNDHEDAYRAFGFGRNHSDDILDVFLEAAMGTGVVRGTDILFPLSGTAIQEFLIRNEKNWISHSLDSIQQKVKRLTTYGFLIRNVPDDELRKKVPASFLYFREQQSEKGHERHCGWFAISLEIPFNAYVSKSMEIVTARRKDGARGTITRDAVIMHKGVEEADKLFVQDCDRNVSKIVQLLHPVFLEIVDDLLLKKSWFTESMVLDLFFSDPSYKIKGFELYRESTAKYVLMKCWPRILRTHGLEWRVINKELRGILDLPESLNRGSKVAYKHTALEHVVACGAVVATDSTEVVVEDQRKVISISAFAKMKAVPAISEDTQSQVLEFPELVLSKRKYQRLRRHFVDLRMRKVADVFRLHQ
jgi:hypothetical protein